MKIIFEQNRLYGALLQEALQNGLTMPLRLITEPEEFVSLLQREEISHLLTSRNILLEQRYLDTMLGGYERIEIAPVTKVRSLQEILSSPVLPYTRLMIVPTEQLSLDPVFFSGHAGLADNLSSTEIMVVRLLANGYSYKMIADQLKISYHTAKTHINHIYKKLGVNNATGAIRAALSRNIIGK